MTDGLGLLLSLPLDSITVRTVIASVVAVGLGRLLLRTGVVRVPRLRAAVALLPGAALLVVLVAFAQAPSLPGLWLPVDASGGLPVRIADTYLSFAPVAASTLLAVWTAVVVVRVNVRVLRGRRVRALARAARDRAVTTPSRLASTVWRLAASMDVTAPDLVVVPALEGGAMVLGIRQPLLVVDARLLASLDDAELEGVVAHELAHVRRRDNLVAASLGLARDMFFFVPGGAWSLSRLLREREHAADTVAVGATGRPGALASGLLKVLEGASSPAVCAPLLPAGTVVERVRVLCDDRPAPSRLRRASEGGATVLAVLIAVLAAAVVPSLLSGDDGQRDALGVLLSDGGGSADPLPATAAAFRVYRGTVLTPPAASEQVTTAAPTEDVVLDAPAAWTPERLDVCRTDPDRCRRALIVPTLPLQPPDVVRVDDAAVARWRLDPVVASGDRELALFWFQRVE
jgi:Zn-dependent protease with chaperone function